ncbi:MAG: LysR family transcriptional regulator [Hespellia sp.]|nr:LysR family transcriptional regulator [Hespellia sp.]
MTILKVAASFLDAAEDLHITQSSLSKQIIKLEKELDIV